MTSEGDSTWSLGALISVPVFLLLGFILIVLGWVFFKAMRDDRDSIGQVIAGAVVVVGLICWIGLGVGMYPFKAEYHQYVTKVGVVEKIESRILGSSDSLQQKFVARYTDGRVFGCEDTRCALVKAGDRLTLACKREWQYAGVDGYDCNFIRNEVASS